MNSSASCSITACRSQAITVSIDNENSSNVQTLTPTATSSLTWTNNLGNPIIWRNNSSQIIQWFAVGASIVVLQPNSVGQQGVLLGMTLSTQCADVAFITFMMPAVPVQYRG